MAVWRSCLLRAESDLEWVASTFERNSLYCVTQKLIPSHQLMNLNTAILRSPHNQMWSQFNWTWCQQIKPDICSFRHTPISIDFINFKLSKYRENTGDSHFKVAKKGLDVLSSVLIRSRSAAGETSWTRNVFSGTSRHRITRRVGIVTSKNNQR